MLSGKTTSNNNNNNNHKRQLSEGIMSTDRSNRLYKGRVFLLLELFLKDICFLVCLDEDRHLILHLVNEYLLEGSNNVLDLIRNCPNECFEALVDFIWNTTTSQTMDNNDEDLLIYKTRTSLLSSSPTNEHRQRSRYRLAIICIEVFKLLATPVINGGRFDIHRQNRLLIFPSYTRQLINVKEIFVRCFFRKNFNHIFVFSMNLIYMV